jgi:uncharacterized cupin superfamily protein
MKNYSLKLVSNFIFICACSTSSSLFAGGGSENDLSIIVHSSKIPLDETKMSLFDGKGFGATNVEGDNPKERIDYANGNVVSGVYSQGPGKAELVWPVTEHSCVQKGKVIITNMKSGHSNTLEAGDCWLVKRGTHVTWEVTEPFIKSFLIVSEAK